MYQGQVFFFRVSSSSVGLISCWPISNKNPCDGFLIYYSVVLLKSRYHLIDIYDRSAVTRVGHSLSLTSAISASVKGPHAWVHCLTPRFTMNMCTSLSGFFFFYLVKYWCRNCGNSKNIDILVLTLPDQLENFRLHRKFRLNPERFAGWDLLGFIIIAHPSFAHWMSLTFYTIAYRREVDMRVLK